MHKALQNQLIVQINSSKCWPIVVTGSRLCVCPHSANVSQARRLQSKATITITNMMSIHASNGTCKFLAGMALGPVHQLSLRLLPAAGHLESPGPVAEVRLGRSLNFLPGRQWNEAHLWHATRSVHQGLRERFQCCAPAAHPSPWPQSCHVAYIMLSHAVIVVRLPKERKTPLRCSQPSQY